MKPQVKYPVSFAFPYGLSASTLGKLWDFINWSYNNWNFNDTTGFKEGAD